MAINAGLTDSQCLKMIEFTSEALMSKAPESAVAAIVEYMRELFGTSYVRVREIIPRPFSFRYTYEATDTPDRWKRINETVTLTEDTWNKVMDKYANGAYYYREDVNKLPPSSIGNISVMPMSLMQVPMFCGKHFLGTIDFGDYDHIREWSDAEMSAVMICANIICQYLYRINTCFMSRYSENDIDPLTGLVSFSVFSEKLDAKLSKMLEDPSFTVAIVYTDIHHFKYINETYGYKKGDELLKLAAQSMLDGADPENDVMLSRVHSDNFVSAAPLPREIVPMFADFIYDQNEILCKLLEDNCPDLKVRMNTGICYVNDQRITAATAIANANLARKRAKADNLRRPLIFDSSMMDDINYQEYLNNELPKAIENHDLKVYYQPKINCADDSLYGAEALVRWQRPDGTFIYPDKFIPVFEKNGNIVDVDFYVYREVFRYIRGRIDAGLPVFPISMNVSRIHFRSDRIIPYIKGLFEEFDVPPSLIEFELTENIYMNNFSKADEFIKICQNMGMQVSMDDFGSGYSSLNVISALKINTLKIDRIFLKSDELDENDKTVIESMIAMAKRLGMNVICEGVETESQSRFLKNAHCDQIQGYYYGRPMNEESFNKFAEEKFR